MYMFVLRFDGMAYRENIGFRKERANAIVREKHLNQQAI
jgi:hypothetical protein